MQVNQISDHVTHAVIGNKVAREAQISNSAEFFNVLSNTLYSDKLLAVIREVLCNAWDIHIQKGITDMPVQITLTDTKLTIRDFGTGIHDDHIVDVYLTYGNSTKKLDGTQTGGFGLGSKAPWAYVDHFEVTSFHDKKKTVYAMSKSSGEVGGKPSALPILTVPTEETGLQVSMAVASKEDARRFNNIIRTIAEFGEMNVVMNDVPLETVAFSQAKHGFMFMKRNRMTHVSGGANNRVFIRYGNVLYPLPEHEKLSAEMSAVTKAADRLSGSSGYTSVHNPYNLILQAKPDTISVTPSRESLSMTDHTIKHAKELLREFITLYDTNLQAEIINTTRETIARTWTTGRPADLLTSNNAIPGLFDGDPYGVRHAPSADILTNIPEASKAYLSQRYPDFRDFKKQDILMRLKALETSGFGNRGKIQSFRREFMMEERGQTPSSFRDKKSGKVCSTWFKRELVLPLVRKLNQVEGLSGDKLLVRGAHRWDDEKSSRRYSYGTQEGVIIEAMKLSPRPLHGYMPFLRNFIVLSFNRIDIEERLSNFPIMKHWLGQASEMFCYVVPRTKGKAEIAKAFFESQGMTVVDLTVAQAWEPQHVVVPIAKPTPAKPRKKGLPLLSGIVKDGKLQPHLIVQNEDFPRIEQPEFIIKLNPRAESSRSRILEWIQGHVTYYAVEMYGSKGGVVVNDNQYARFKGMGIPSFEEWLIRRISDELMTNPRLQTLFTMRMESLPRELQSKMIYQKRQVLQLILGETKLSQQFGLGYQVTAEDRKIFSIYNGLKDYRHYLQQGNLQAAHDHVMAVPADPNLEALVKKLTESRLLGVFDTSHIETVFEIVEKTPTKEYVKQKEGIIDLLLYAIEG